MKNLRWIFTFLLITTITDTVLAQETGDVIVKAEVNSALTLTPAPLNFGEISTGSNAVIPANNSDNAQSANVGVNSSAGSLIIEASDLIPFLVTFPTNIKLAKVGDENDLLDFTPKVFNGNSEVTVNGTANLLTVPAGVTSITLDVGGTLSLAGLNKTGSYSTDNTGSTRLIFTVQYN